ncbi:lysine N(6)-hydroxylase/L-ornithine N(5)-oxygenase family protein [Kitasatospora sp. NPDC088346]|uniref:lysine N(6)-hydroxylase/L-ornithine N(5)-oxygenase family protein n=1 Tax=Kitasatospora sp. NPDC088346 TaxID=3364073 RepID=UPI0038063549
MTDHEVGVLAIGAGPANLALAAAIEESGNTELADSTLLLEQAPDIKWQRDLLMPWARSQVSFLKDLVTLRNPRSKYSFLNFLHDQGRLDQFVNLGTFHPFRWEFSDYLQWVATTLEHVQIRYNARVTTIDPLHDHSHTPTGWHVTLDNGDTIRTRDLVIGAGRDPHIPRPFTHLPPDRVIHSSRYRTRISGIPRDQPLRTVVIGGAQSAAEMFYALHDNLPHSTITMIVRSIGLQNYQTSKFINELFFPSFVDEFHDSPPEIRAQVLDEMRLTNYAGLAPPFLDELYTMLYRQRILGTPRATIHTMTEVTHAHYDDHTDTVTLDLKDRRTGKTTPLPCDLVLLGTGYDTRMPALVRDLATKTGLPHINVTRNYRIDLGRTTTAAIYLQGVNEATHGIADSLISVLAQRSHDITTDLLTRRTTTPRRAG